MTNGIFKAMTVIAGGFQTRYLEAGDSHKPTVVLLHDGAFGTTAELCWGNVIKLLSPHYHLLVPEMLGWGGTDKVVYFDRSPYAARIPHITAFLNVLDVKSADFVGASFGGSLLMRAALTVGNPWNIRRAISISGTGGPFRLQSGINALSDYVPSLEAAQQLTGLMVRNADGLDEHIRQRHQNSLIPGHWESLSAPRLQNPSVERARPNDSYLDDLAALSVPILLIAGRFDALLETGWANQLAAQSSQITVTEMDVGHEPNIDAPKILCTAILDFLGEGDARL